MELQAWKGDWGLPTVDPQCLTVITYCKLCGSDVPLVPCKGSWNGKKLPVLTLSDTEEYLETPQNIINFLISREVRSDEHLPPRSVSDMTALICLITESLHTALMYSLWLDDSNYQNVTLPLYRSIYKLPWSYLKATEMRRYVKCMILARYSLDDNIELEQIASKVFDASKRCMQILSTKLDSQQYMFGNVPTQLDAYMFGHLAIIRSCPFKSQLKDNLAKLSNLTEYTQRLHRKYYPNLLRQYTPISSQEDKIINTQVVHQAASISAVVILGALFLWFRSPNQLMINDTQLRQD